MVGKGCTHLCPEGAHALQLLLSSSLTPATLARWELGKIWRQTEHDPASQSSSPWSAKKIIKKLFGKMCPSCSAHFNYPPRFLNLIIMKGTWKENSPHGPTSWINDFCVTNLPSYKNLILSTTKDKLANLHKTQGNSRPRLCFHYLFVGMEPKYLVTL